MKKRLLSYNNLNTVTQQKEFTFLLKKDKFTILEIKKQKKLFSISNDNNSSSKIG